MCMRTTPGLKDRVYYIIWHSKLEQYAYGRTSVAQTPMARFELVLESLTNTQTNPTAADIIVFRISLGDFLFYIENSMLCVSH